MIYFTIKFRHQVLYENTKKELTRAKEKLVLVEMESKKHQNSWNDQYMETIRLEKLLEKKDNIIQELNLQIEKFQNKEKLNSSVVSNDALASKHS